MLGHWTQRCRPGLALLSPTQMLCLLHRKRTQLGEVFPNKLVNASFFSCPSTLQFLCSSMLAVSVHGPCACYRKSSHSACPLPCADPSVPASDLESWPLLALCRGSSDPANSVYQSSCSESPAFLCTVLPQAIGSPCGNLPENQPLFLRLFTTLWVS